MGVYLEKQRFPQVFIDVRVQPGRDQVKLHFEPWLMKKGLVFDVFRDVVYGCPSIKILTKVKIVKIASLEAIGSPSGTKGVPTRLRRCL